MILIRLQMQACLPLNCLHVSFDSIRGAYMNQGTAFPTACAPSADSNPPAHPCSLIRVFAGHSKCSQGYNTSTGGQQRLISLRDSDVI